MKHFVWGLFLGLFAAVHSTPVNTVTQIPTKHEGDVYQEAEQDGFLVDHLVFTSATPSPTSTTQSPKAESSQTAEIILTSPQPSEKLEGSGSWSDLMLEGSGETTSSGFGVDGSGHSTTSDLLVLSTSTQISETFASSSTESSKISTTVESSQQPLINIMVEGSGEGTSSGFGVDGSGESPTTALSATESVKDKISLSSTSESTKMSEAPQVPVQETIRSNNNQKQHSSRILQPETEDASTPVNAKNQAKPNHFTKAHTTPDWIIIVGFIVGLAALVAVCAAIATREKWNGPNQVSEAKPNSSNQKMELEMQTFLHKDEPKENGKEAEYTVIPLDDLPEDFSSD